MLIFLFMCAGDWNLCRVWHPAPGRLTPAPHCCTLRALLQVQVTEVFYLLVSGQPIGMPKNTGTERFLLNFRTQFFAVILPRGHRYFVLLLLRSCLKSKELLYFSIFLLFFLFEDPLSSQ
jgi:hypothetical protein